MLPALFEDVDIAVIVMPLYVTFLPSLTRLNQLGLLIILMFCTSTFVAWKRVKMIGRNNVALAA